MNQPEKKRRKRSNKNDPSCSQQPLPLPSNPNPRPKEPPPAANDDQEKAQAANDDQEKARPRRRQLPPPRPRPPRPPEPPPVGVGDDGNGCPFFGQEALIYQGLLCDPDFPTMNRRQRQAAGKRLTDRLPRGHQICLSLTPPGDLTDRIGLAAFRQRANGPHGVVHARNCRAMLMPLNARDEFMKSASLTRRLNIIINAVARALGLTR